MHIPTDPPPTPPAIATIGVYGFTGNSFLERLSAADVRLVLVSASAAAFADRSTRGPTPGACGAPSPPRRWAIATTPSSPRRASCASCSTPRTPGWASASASRVELAPEYVRRYTTEVLDRVDLSALVTALPAEDLAALLCVERDHEACHRSLIAARLADHHGFTIEHLHP